MRVLRILLSSFSLQPHFPCGRITSKIQVMMLPSRNTFRTAFAILIAVCFTTVGSFYEFVWSGSVASHVKPLFEACTNQLAAATDGEVTRERFAKLVTNLSGQSVLGPFERLPLKFRSLFNSHACMDGRNCVSDFAAIAVSTKEERRLTCSSLASLLSTSMTWNVTRSENNFDSAHRGISTQVCMMTEVEPGAMTCVSK